MAEQTGRLRHELLEALHETERRLARRMGPAAAKAAVVEDLMLAFMTHQERAREQGRAMEKSKRRGRR